MKETSVFRSDKMKTLIAVLITMAVFVFFYIVLVYGMLREQIEDLAVHSSEYGLSYYYDMQNYTEAERCFKKALFLEKNIIFWDNNERLPSCYSNLALVNGGLEKYEKSAELYEEALLAYEKYLPQDDGNIALVHLKVSLIYSIMGNNNMVLEHAGLANDYYQSLEREQQDINAATAALELAYAYYNAGDYENAAIHFETGIPIVYNVMFWEIDDTVGPGVLAIAYRVAADTYGKLENEEMKEYYEKEYENMIWIRQISENEIEEYMRSFHWGM